MNEILSLWACGFTQSEIGKRLKLSKGRVNAAIAKARAAGDPRAAERSGAGLRFGVRQGARARNQKPRAGSVIPRFAGDGRRTIRPHPYRGYFERKQQMAQMIDAARGGNAKVRARLAKVLALARRAGTEGERLAALAAVGRIQAEHGIR